MKIHCTIFGSDNEEQEVQIEFYFTRTRHWFSPSDVEVTELLIHTPLSVSPSDLNEDLTAGIATALWIGVDQVRIECEVQEAVNVDMQFI